MNTPASNILATRTAVPTVTKISAGGVGALAAALCHVYHPFA
jgi:hypothetical protein